jgi:hypothetical protein
MYGSEADINGDCVVNEGDLQILVGDWLDRDSIVYAQPANPDGLVAQFLFDGDLTDASGNGRDGIPHGDIGFEDDPVMGQVLDLPGGGDQYVSIPPVGIEGAMPRTITCWAKADHMSIPDWTLIFGFTTPGGGCGSHFNIGSIGGPGGVGAHAWCWERTIFTDQQALEWRHYAMTYDGTTISYYGDAELVGAEAFALSHGDYVNIGKRNTQASAFPGNVEDARIYNYALSREEIIDTMSMTELYSPASASNIYDDEPKGARIVNFKDYAVLMSQWLEETQWP